MKEWVSGLQHKSRYRIDQVNVTFQTFFDATHHFTWLCHETFSLFHKIVRHFNDAGRLLAQQRTNLTCFNE